MTVREEVTWQSTFLTLPTRNEGKNELLALLPNLSACDSNAYYTYLSTSTPYVLRFGGVVGTSGFPLYLPNFSAPSHYFSHTIMSRYVTLSRVCTPKSSIFASP